MPEHSTLTGSSLHEPKGVASASANTVYVADGSGSGAWSSLPGTISNRVVVTQESDFGTASGGSITTSATPTEYVVVGEVVMTNRLVLGDHVLIRGIHPELSQLTYTGTNDFITTNDFVLDTRDIRISAANQTASNFVFNGTSSDGSHSINLKNVEVTDCYSFLRSSRCPVIAESVNVLDLTSRAFELEGVISLVSIKLGASIDSSASAQHLNFNSSTVSKFYMEGWVFAGLGTAIDGTAGSANIAASNRAEYNRLDFTNIATPLNNITTKDAGHHFRNCFGISNSYNGSQAGVEGNATATTIAAVGSGNAVLVDFDGGMLEDSGAASRVSIDSDGRVTNTGRLPHNFKLTANIYAEIGGGAAREYVFLWAKGGTINTTTAAKNTFDGSNPGSVSCSAIIQLDPNEYAELYVYQVANAVVDVTVDTCSINALEVL